MTAKSRLRKRKKHNNTRVAEKIYAFETNTRTVLISATSLQEAKQQFQERYGYWPTKENKDGDTHPSTEAGTA